MRHGVSQRKFNRQKDARKALFSNLVVSLIEHEQIVTTLPKAKDLRPVIEKIVTMGKEGDLAARRRVLAFTRNNQEAVSKLFSEIAPRFKTRNGGYTRIIKTGFRQGDAAPMAVIEFVERDIRARGKKDRALVAAQQSAHDAANASE